MFIERHYLAHRSVRKRHHIVYIIFSVAIMLSIAIDMSLHHWLRYCWWDFGLVYASSFTTFTNFSNEQTISDVSSDACQSLQSLVEENCPHFCDYLSDLEAAGVLMIVFGSLSLMFYLIAVLFHLWSFFKVQFKFKKILVFLVMPSVLYCLGVIMYNSIVNILGIKSPNTSRFETKSPEIKEGLYFSYAIVPLSILHSAYGVLQTRIAFIETAEG